MSLPLLKALKKSTSYVVGREVITLIVILIIITHIFLVSVYVYLDHKDSRLFLHEKASQRIINVIRIARATPSDSLNNAIEAINNPNLTISITKQPTWRRHFHKRSSLLKTYKDLIKVKGRYTQASYKASTDLWLNITSDINPSMRKITLIFLIMELFNILIILVYSWAIYRLSKPLKNLKHAAEKLALEGTTTTLPLFGPAMIREATNSMNKMQKRILELLKERTLTLAALSHDLRTPITRLRLRAQLMQDENEKQKLIHDADEMEKMVNDTIIFAKQNYVKDQKRLIDLASLLKSICDDAADLKAPVTYHSKIRKLTFLGDPTTLHRAFTNIIGNALKYGKKAKVTLAKESHKIIITIDDDGPGIIETEKSKIFEPFYRTERSRSKETGGSGLGLAIAKSIILSHSGSIAVENLSPRGLRVTVTFKL